METAFQGLRLLPIQFLVHYVLTFLNNILYTTTKTDLKLPQQLRWGSPCFNKATCSSTKKEFFHILFP